MLPPPPTSPLSPPSENKIDHNHDNNNDNNKRSTLLSKVFNNIEEPNTVPPIACTPTSVTKVRSNSNASANDNVLFSEAEIVALRLMFSFFDRSGSNTISYEDLVAYAEETGETTCIRDAGTALDHLDIDGDGKIGLLDFFYFAARLKANLAKR
jgi:Ca2+-binding EF-hand superfamily protein